MSEQIIKTERKYTNLEGGLRYAFEEAIKTAFKEIERRNKSGCGGNKFAISAEVTGENGQGFKMIIEFFPPKIPMIPSQN